MQKLWVGFWKKVQTMFLVGTWVPLVIFILSLSSPSSQAASYIFSPSVADWYTAGLEPAHNDNCIRPIPTVIGYIHAEGITWQGSSYPTPAAGTWGGARWNAPPGEVVTQVRMTGYFRRQTSGVTDFCAKLYGKDRTTSTYSQLLDITSSSGTIPGNVSYDRTATIPASSNISTLEFRAWQAVAGNLVIAANNSGYSGNINVIEITTTSATVANLLTLGNSNVRITMTQQGEILKMEDLTTNTQVLVANASPAMRIWPFDRSANPSLYPITSLNYNVPAVATGTNYVQFTWSKTGYPILVGRVTFDPVKEQFLFSSTVTNNYSTYTVKNVAFPATLAFDDAANNYLAVCSDLSWTSPLKPLDQLEPFSVTYPSYLHMQMAGFKIGNSSILVYTDDPNAHVKSFSFQHNNSNVQLNLSQRIWLRPTQVWNAPYNVVLKAIPNGTYNELADEYATWGRAQSWAQLKLTDKITRTPRLNRYFKNGLIRMNAGPPVCTGNTTTQGDPNYTFYQTLPDTLWHYNIGNIWSQYEPYYDSVLSTIAQYEAAYGIKPGWWYPNWAGYQFDSPYPDYFHLNNPDNNNSASWMGDFDAFHAGIIQRGSPIMYHMNIVHWPSWTPTAQNSNYWAVTESGYYYRNYGPTSPLFFSWSKTEGLMPSPSISLPVEMGTVNRLKDTVGINGVYLDEFGQSYITDDNPNLQTANTYYDGTYYDKPNAYQLEKINAIQNIRAAVTGPMMIETRNEILMPYTDMGTIPNGPNVDDIPLWGMVYGDCVATTTYPLGDKRQRYYTWMIGGVSNMTQEWPTVGGKAISVFLTSTQQRVISHIITERMTRFDKFGNARMSQWPSGIVAWNRQTTGQPINISTATTLGTISISQLATGGIAILTNSNDFCADSVNTIIKNGVTLFSNQSGSPLSVTRAGGRWVIHNENATAVNAVLQIDSSFGNTLPLRGKTVTGDQTINVQPVAFGGMITLQLTIPANDCVVLGEVKTYIFSPTVSNWWTAGLSPVHSNNALRPVTSYLTYLHVEGIFWDGTNYPVVAAGHWAGANWTAPPGEVVTNIHVTGYYRRDTSLVNDFGYAIFGGTSTGSPQDTCLCWKTSLNGTIPGTVSYNEIIPVNTTQALTQLQFRPWQSIVGGQIASYNSGYSGNINLIEITTQATGEP
jgi:hypothetical protein